MKNEKTQETQELIDGCIERIDALKKNPDKTDMQEWDISEREYYDALYAALNDKRGD